MDKKVLRQIGWVTASLGLTAALIGCSDAMDEAAVAESQGAALASTNGLAAVNGLGATNGLTGTNGLMGTNGLAATNGLAGTNGLAATNGLMTTDGGRKTVEYIVKCALAKGDSIVKQDQYGNNYTYGGNVGVCPDWKYGSITSNYTCQELISACVMAHLNTAGIHVPLWLDSGAQSIGWGLNSAYPYQEGTFFGNVLVTGGMNHGAMLAPAGFYCDGDGFAQGSSGVVAGRIGAGQGFVPYLNPFGNGALCKNNCTGEWSGGMYDSYGHLKNPDGYKACTGFNTMITVWRNNNYTPQFDNVYRYRLQPSNVNGTLSMDVTNGSTSNGTAMQLWTTWDGDMQKFSIAPSGSNWKIAMKTNTNKCLDLRSGATGNNTQIVINDCNGASSQAWTITPDVQSGNFYFKNAAAGRCLEDPNWSWNTGQQLDIYDCSNGSNMLWKITAVL